MYNNYTDIIVEWNMEFLISNTYVKLMVTAVLEINVSQKFGFFSCLCMFGEG